MADLDSWNIL